jgi:hypothetical protein
LFPLRDAYLFDVLNQVEAAWGDPATPNPPHGALFTYHVGQAPAGDAKLVLTIADDTGKQVRRLDLARTTGVHRIAWDLRGAAPVPAAGARGGADAAGRGRAGSDPPALPGRGRQGGPPASPGRYRATIEKMSGETATAIGQPQTFVVVPLTRSP